MSSIDIQTVLEVVDENNGLTYAQICKILQARGKNKDSIKIFLKKLINQKKITRDKNKKYFSYQATSSEEYRIGRLEVHENGFGFCISENNDFDDIFVPKKFMRNASHLDLVKVQILPTKYGKKEEGVVVEIIDETDRTWMGVVFPFEDDWYFTPWGKRLQFLLPEHQKLPLQEDDIVLAQIEKSKENHFRVHITKVLGNINNPKIDSELLIFEHQLTTEFSKSALADANNTEVVDDCAHIRKDLRHLAFVTIDGEDAKDFDDAVFMDENHHLWVAIADVSNFVKANSTLDIEACDRGNSFYFPDCVIPMLPEILSNDLCSLRPFETKYAMVAEISFDKNLVPRLEQVTPALIESKARLTYNKVASGLQNPLNFESVYRDSLVRLHKHTKLSYQKRLENGAIDFNMPEIRFFPDSIEPKLIERNDAHQLIEECMLATNQVTCKFVDAHSKENVYRVHEKPDPLKLKDAVDILMRMFHKEKSYSTPQDAFDIQDIIDDLKGHPNITQIQYLFLRAMAQARYDTKPFGHFGLGFTHYSHFTSPIRRYADLVLHRIIKNILLNKNKELFPKNYDSLNNVCVHISKQDRKSLVIERDMRKIKGIRFMQNHIGEVFDGSIAGILPRGIFVETFPFGIEGFVPMKHLQIKGYRFDTMNNQFVSQKNILGYGSMLKVIVKQTNLFKRQLDFEIKSIL